MNIFLLEKTYSEVRMQQSTSGIRTTEQNYFTILKGSQKQSNKQSYKEPVFTQTHKIGIFTSRDFSNRKGTFRYQVLPALEFQLSTHGL